MADGHKSLALDTNVFFDLADGARFAHAFKDAFQSRGYALKAPPTVLAEIANFSVHGSDHQKELAITTLKCLTEWKITPIILSDVEQAYRKNFMSLVEQRSILPDGEINDSRILAETSIGGVQVPVTSDSGILGADQAELSLAFDDAGLAVVAPAHPARLHKALH